MPPLLSIPNYYKAKMHPLKEGLFKPGSPSIRLSFSSNQTFNTFMVSSIFGIINFNSKYISFKNYPFASSRKTQQYFQWPFVCFCVFFCSSIVGSEKVGQFILLTAGPQSLSPWFFFFIFLIFFSPWFLLLPAEPNHIMLTPSHLADGEAVFQMLLSFNYYLIYYLVWKVDVLVDMAKCWVFWSHLVTLNIVVPK